MKNKGINTTTKLPVVVLILIMLLPSIIQIFHIFEEHEHLNVCKEVTTHLHEKEIDCSLCDFHISLFNFSVNNISEYNLVEFSSCYVAYYKSKKHNSIKRSERLRGPPMF